MGYNPRLCVATMALGIPFPSGCYRFLCGERVGYYIRLADITDLLQEVLENKTGPNKCGMGFG